MTEEWTTCTMCRALTTGQDVLHRAKDRAVDWPKPLSHPQNNVSFSNLNLSYIVVERCFVVGVILYDIVKSPSSL